MTALLLLALVAADPPKVPNGKDGQPDYEAGLNDLLGKGVTTQNNAAVLLIQAFGPTPEGTPMPPEFYRRLGTPEPPKNGAYFVGQTKFATDGLKLNADNANAFYDAQGKASRAPWAANQYPQLAAWITANERPLLLVTEAAKRPEYYNPLVSRRTDNTPGGLIGVLLPTVQKSRELVAILTARAMLRLGEKKYDAAWDDLLTCHRLGRLVGRGGTLIEGLVGIAIEAISANATLAFIEKADLTAAQLRGKLKDLQSLPRPAKMADKLDQAERFMFLDCVEMLRRGGLGSLEHLAGGDAKAPKLTPEQRKAWEKLDWEPLKTTAATWYDRMGAGMRLPTRAERNAELDKIEAEMKTLKKGGNEQELIAQLLLKGPGQAVTKSIGDVLISLLMPAVRKVQEAEDRNTQTQQNLQLAVAMAIYRKDTGKYPPTLDALAPKYIAAVPGDSFTGRPLVYKLEGAGYVFYSLGMNGKDDGGQWMDDTPKGDDIRVRMPIVPPKQP